MISDLSVMLIIIIFKEFVWSYNSQGKSPPEASSTDALLNFYVSYRGDITYGIKAGVKTLGLDWAQNSPTCFILELHVY